MVTEVLVRNYYERNGMDGAAQSYLWQYIEDVAKIAGVTTNDVWDYCLGYTDFIGGHSSVNTRRDAIASGERIMKVKVPTPAKLTKEEAEITKLLAYFYQNDLTYIVETFDGSQVRFALWLIENKGISPSNILKGNLVKFEPIKMVVREGVEPQIYGQTLYVPKALKSSSFKKVTRQALAIASGYRHPVYQLNVMELSDEVLMSYNKKILPKYLELLDYCSSESKLYADMMQEIRVNVPDLLHEFWVSGTIFMTLNDSCFLVYQHDSEGWIVKDRELLAGIVEKAKPYREQLESEVPILAERIKQAKNAGDHGETAKASESAEKLTKMSSF